MSFKKFYKDNTKLVKFVAIPLVASILPIAAPGKPAYCGYILIIMSGYWITECLPLGITSLLPVLLFPLFGILDSKNTSKIYFEDINMLFLGGLIMALAIENTNLHQRIALKVIMFFGSNPKWLLLGIMIVTAFLSLWVSNTAAASMMLPIVVEIVKQLIKTKKDLFRKKDRRMSFSNVAYEMEKMDDILKENDPSKADNDLLESEDAKKLLKGFCLSITYSASIGGTGSLVGSNPNLILKGFYDHHYPDAGLNFLTYMLFTIPGAIIMIIATWTWLTYLWLPRHYFLNVNLKKIKSKFNSSKHLPKKEKIEDDLKKLMNERYTQLGPFTWEQKSVAFLFILLVLLWVTRDIYFFPGWGSLFKKKFVSDTTAAIFIVIALVAWPKFSPFKGEKYEHLLDWKTINDSFPWYILLLGGGGLAIAEGFQKSKLSELIGDLLKNIVPNNATLTLLIIILVGVIGTEFTSNASMASILLPVVNALAQKNLINPSFLLLPLTLSVSFAFMLPVATPTNAVIFSSGYIKIKDMVLSGLILKVVGIFVILLMANLWLELIFVSPFDNNTRNQISNQTDFVEII